MSNTQSIAVMLARLVATIASAEEEKEGVRKEVARLQRAAIDAIHAATGRIAAARPFPQDATAPPVSALEHLFAIDGGSPPSPWLAVLRDELVTHLLPSIRHAPRQPLGMDAPWLAYGCELLLPRCYGDEPPAQCTQAARALGLATRVVEELEDLFRAPAANTSLSVPPYLLSAIAGEESGRRAGLELGWSAFLAPWPDDFALRLRLGDEAVLERISQRFESWLAQTRTLPISTASSSSLEEFLTALRSSYERAWGCARLCGWLPEPWTPTRLTSELERTLRGACAALTGDERLYEAWEIQRWGTWCEEPRTAYFFPVGLCLLALNTARVDVSARAALLLAEGSADCYRYYHRWPGIPPDADDVGLALRMLPLARDQEPLRAAMGKSVDLLLRNTGPDGWVDTYLEQGLDEPPPTSSPIWQGRRCLAVAANALLGILSAGWPAPREWMDRVLRRIASTLRDSRLSTVACYPACYARLVLAFLERELENQPCDPAAQETLTAALTLIGQELLDTRELDGGWGSPLQTACHLAFLALRRTPHFDPAPSIIYLCVRQEPDGLWKREPLYISPGRDNAPHWYGSRSVTAALCLEALALARDAWPSPD